MKKKAEPEVTLPAANTAAASLCDGCGDVHLVLFDESDEPMVFVTLSPDAALELAEELSEVAKKGRRQ
jgi:hypothetical protein